VEGVRKMRQPTFDSYLFHLLKRIFNDYHSLDGCYIYYGHPDVAYGRKASSNYMMNKIRRVLETYDPKKGRFRPNLPPDERSK